jgi:hypothetical protein
MIALRLRKASLRRGFSVGVWLVTPPGSHKWRQSSTYLLR